LEAHYGDRVVGCYVERPESIDHLLTAAVERWPDALAISDEARTLSYAALDHEVEAIAAGLQDVGISRGDRVALLLVNSVEFLVVLCAVARLGAISVPINVREQAPELRRLLQHSGAGAIFYEAELSHKLPDSALPNGLARIAVRGDAPNSTPYSQLSSSQQRASRTSVYEEDTAIILYTSGTTGQPKGAMLTHLGLVSAALTYVTVAGLRKGDSAAVPAPMSHVTGITSGLLPMLLVGGRIVSFREFKAAAYLRRIAAERVTFMVMVPAMYALCLLQPQMEQLDLTAWRVGGYGGAPMAGPLIVKLAERLPRLQLINTYGSTETTGPQSIGVPADALRKRDCVGVPVPGAEIIIMDDEAHVVPPGETGEIWIRSGSVCRGYWNDPGATAAEFVGGFWKSGDVGRFDEEGFLQLLDRKKDVINRGGYKIYSSEVESVLLARPGVVEAAAVAYPCPVLGERVHAFVTVTDERINVAALLEHCARHLADYKVPERFTVGLIPLPRNANGKILKRDLAVRSDPSADVKVG
jgi:acyl-CoA synthetase (AMP-forming)/AMP-acid ligase II